MRDGRQYITDDLCASDGCNRGSRQCLPVHAHAEVAVKQYVAIDADTWQTPKVSGYRVACCDCGLVHEMDFRIKEGVIQYRVRRNNRATAAKRRYKRGGA